MTSKMGGMEDGKQMKGNANDGRTKIHLGGKQKEM